MAYFDNAATSFYKPDSIYTESVSLYKNYGLNYTRSKTKKSNILENIREDLDINIKSILSLENNTAVICTSSSTLACNQILNGLDYSNIKNVYITPFEHNCVYRTLLNLQKKYNFNLNLLKHKNFDIDMEKTKIDFMSQKPDLVVSTHASNVFGNIISVQNIFDEAKKYGAVTVLDASQTIGTYLFGKEDNKNTDFIFFSGHKSLMGFTGIGVFIINNPSIKLDPFLFGGTGIKSEEVDMPDELPEKYEVGTPNILGIISLKLSTDWILKEGLEKIINQKKENFKKLMDILEEHSENIEIYSPKENNIGIVSILSDEFSPQELGIMLDEKEIEVRTGLHCAPLAHETLGTKSMGTVRFSVSYFNTEKEFEELVDALDEILY